MKPLKYSCQQIEEEDIAAVVRVLRSDYLTCGPEVERFEAALCEYTGAKYAVAVNSGTAALELAARAVFDAKGVATVPAMSFVATASAMLQAGQGVELVDVDPATANALPCTADVVVHFAGRPADPGAGQWYIEDAAHAIGAACGCGCGTKVGACRHSTVTTFSFHAVKSVACGEGGACTTNDAAIADRIRRLRSHGRDERGMVELAGNARLTEMQAALGRSQLERLDGGISVRAELAALYTDLLRNVVEIECPPPMPNGAWHLYATRVDPKRRDMIRADLAAQGIQTQYHYSPAIHRHPFFDGLYVDTDDQLPNADAWARSELSLPLHVGMRDSDVRRVVGVLREAL